jgi:Zn-dependent alcohol dehydrogenase
MPPSDQVVLSGMDLMMGKTVRQSVMGSARPAVDIPRLVEHTLAGRLDLAPMIEGTRPLDELPAALDDLEAGRVLGRTIITF